MTPLPAKNILAFHKCSGATLFPANRLDVEGRDPVSSEWAGGATACSQYRDRAQPCIQM